MDIEIVTTKRKLTKSILIQIPEADASHMASCQVLGYISNVHPDCHKVILIKTVTDNKYYLVKVGYSTDIKKENEAEYTAYRRYGKWSWSRKFKDFESYSAWRLNYIRVCQVANSSQQIYI